MKRYAKALYRRVRPAKPEPVVFSGPEFLFCLDRPAHTTVSSKSIKVSGWFLPLRDHETVSLRLRNGKRTIPIQYGSPRADVAALYAGHYPEKAREACGFSSKAFTFTDGPFIFEADLGDGYREVFRKTIHYSEAQSVDQLTAPNLSDYWAEHLNKLAARKTYYYEAAPAEPYVRSETDSRLVTFYLPQFHPIKENDIAWGEGFTEWTNVTTAQPRFVGHQQPMLPRDNGFYDLRNPEIMANQIAMAKHHGIYGFCFYYYWFSGKRLLEKPLDIFLEHKDWDFNFTICWANENWTRRWDGFDNDVIVAQKYLEDDPLRFIQDVEDILLDPRYITEDGKPVLIVYRVSQLGDAKLYTETWRRYFRETHGKELHLVAMMGFDVTDPRTYGFDAGIEFPPLTTVMRRGSFKQSRLPQYDIRNQLLDINYSGGIVDYRKIATDPKTFMEYDFPAYRGVMPSWDNEARKKGKGSTFHNATPEVYQYWLERIVAQETAKRQSPLVFVNAWNEWAEGAVLEPTLHYGRAVLNRTTEVIAKHSQASTDVPAYGIQRDPDVDIAVVIHFYYIEEWNYIRKKLQHLAGHRHDVFITLSERLAGEEQAIKAQLPNATVKIVPNIGRDILPFIFMAQRLRVAGYKKILKLHTKKSFHRTDGDDWFKELVTDLLPSPKVVDQIVRSLDEADCGMVGPAGHFVSLQAYVGSNGQALQQLYEAAHGAKKALDVTAHDYFAGSMFWINTASMDALLDQYLTVDDFEVERGQIDGTMAHAVERFFGVLNASHMRQVDAKGVTPVDERGTDAYRFA